MSSGLVLQFKQNVLITKFTNYDNGTPVQAASLSGLDKLPFIPYCRLTDSILMVNGLPYPENGPFAF